MRTFGMCNIDSVLRDIDDEMKFAERLRDNYRLPPDARRKRLNMLNGAERSRATRRGNVNRWMDSIHEELSQLEAEAREEEGREEP